MDFQSMLSLEYMGNTVKEYLIALGIYFVLYISFKVFRSILLGRLKKLAQATSTKFDDELVNVFEKVHPYFYDLVALYIAFKFVNIPENFMSILDGAFVILLSIQAVISLENFLAYIIKNVFMTATANKEQDQTALNAIRLIVKIILWSVGLLMILSNLGVNISSLVASLGIGGIAVALAAQNILGDLFSSFSIYFDKPFEIGDFIIVGTDMGTVQKIGMKSTRIRTLQGEELVISNKELTTARIQNFKKMEKRRIVFSIGVTYDTNLEKVKKIPEILSKIVDDNPRAELDRAHFKEFGASSLNFEIVYNHLSGDYKEYMDIRQEMNFAIKDIFEKEGIEMAFPTQTLHLVKA